MAAVFGAAAASQALWVDWATVEGGNFVPGTSDTLVGARVSFLAPYAGVFGDQGQFRLEIRPTSSLTAYDYTGTANPAVPGTGVAIAGTFQWLLNNVAGTAVQNSHLLGTSVASVGASTVLTSTGVWDWYYQDFGQSALAPNFTGRFRLIEGANEGTLRFQAEAVPEPMTLALAAAGLGAAIRRRRARA